MSFSEEENFDINGVSGSESDDFKPVKKATKASAKATKAKAAAKPAAKTKVATKKKPLVDLDENVEESFMDADSDEPGPSLQREAPDPNRKKKTASELYTKLTHLEQILLRPDSYIGSVETITEKMWIFDSDNKRMVNREIKYVPGFFKIVDEILVNAADNKTNDPNMDTLKVNINVEEGTISVYNNGRGIPIEIHSREKIYIPELIFGHLLSSSNYDDDEKKLTGGRNGYGAKLANIYSHEFTVDTADKNTQQKYKQTWTENMGNVGKAKITKNSKGEEYTRITFRPDLKRFGMDRIDDDTVALLKRRVYDMAGVVKDVKVFLNDERLKVKGFKSYVEMYLSSAAAQAEANSGGAAQAKPTVVYEQIGNRWEIAFALSEGSFQQVSFANAIATTKGGTHVNAIADQLAKDLMAATAKKNKAATVKVAQVKNHMWLFVNALIENPTFDSQTKETLTLPASKFGTKPKLTDEFYKKVQKSGILDSILDWAKFKADLQAKKTDGSKRSRLTGLPKLSDANNAGTKYAENCTLILTEGDSAKALAVAGLTVVGRDNFGVFPLRGKLLNVREAKHESIMKNEEIQNIKKILGLQHNKEYSNVSSLRYGRLMIMTDQDHDGSHIKGLLINFLDHHYPSLLKIPNFLVEFVTPIVRVRKGKQVKDFFTIPEYEQWLEEVPDAHKWDSKYYKGLGTSRDEDGMDYFSNMAKHMIPFAPAEEGDKELIELAFSKKKADERKEWLRQFKPGTYLDHNMDEISYSDFFNKELILFSMADNIRSIPSVVDGLKPGQRKVIWGCFKRKLKKEIKVAQLTGYISEHAAYHHGEQSLMATIVNLAQQFVGSNNINLLQPNGQYGTRDQGGKDHASARYIFTQLSLLTRAIFHPADDPLLNNLKEDNDVIEPEWYMPTVPMVLINGSEGIGTGWSTSIPSYNPADIVANLRRLMNDEEVVPMLPWWRGFKGDIKKVGEHKYDVTGIAEKVDDTTVRISELPIHMWTVNFKKELEAMIGDGKDGAVKDFKEHSDNINVDFLVTMSQKELEKAEAQGFNEYFKLTTKINTGNMICFDPDGSIKKYNSAEHILEEFYPLRLAYYQRRKDFLAGELQNQFEKFSNQARFVKMIVDKQLTVSNRKKAAIVTELREKNFRPFPKVSKAKAAGEVEDVIEEEELEGADSDYDYLLGMAIYSLTQEKIEKLNQQAADKETELLALLERTPIQVWNEDLDHFLAEWERDCEEWRNRLYKDSKGKKVKRSQKVLETRKSLPGPGRRKGDDFSDDDFKPTKSAAKLKKATESKAVRAKPAAPSNPVKDDDDSDGDLVLPPPPKKRLAPKTIKGGSESDVEVVAAPKKASRSKQLKADSDSDVEMVPAPATKGKGKGKESPKRKSPDADDSDDAYMKPVKKKAAIGDFFDKVPKPAAPRKASGSTTVRKASGNKVVPTKKTSAKRKKADSDDDDMDGSRSPSVPARTSAPKRVAARAPAKKYIDLSDDEDGDDNDGSMFAEY